VTVEASLPQAAVLLQFNDYDSLSAMQLCNLLGMSLSDLKPVFLVLIETGLLYTVLRAAERGCDAEKSWGNRELIISSDTVLHAANRTPVCHRNSRGHIPLALLSYQGDDQSRINRARVDLDGDRRQQIKACIVRIMKLAQGLAESELVRQVRAKLARLFAVRDGDVVDSISLLVETEYIEYNEDGTFVLYVA
jgi:hypothetical protein